MSDESVAIRLVDIAVAYDSEAVVRDVSLAVEAREMHVLLGESGSGKTTILRAIAGFESIAAGCIELHGVAVDRATQKGSRRGEYVPPEKRGVGVVFQDYALFPHLDVAGNVAFAMRGRLARERVAERVQELLERVGLAGLGGRGVAELSGGQQQRVALARALAQQPRIMLLDEPFSNLNRELRRELREATVEILRKFGVTAIFVTHDRHEAFSIADRISVVHEGALLQTGTPEEIYDTPSSIAVARSVGEINVLPATVAESGNEAHCALGLVPLSAPAPAGRQGQILLRPHQIVVASTENTSSEMPEAENLAKKGSKNNANGRDDPARSEASSPFGVVEKMVYYGSFAEIRVLLAGGDQILAHAEIGTLRSSQRVVSKINGPGVWVPG